MPFSVYARKHIDRLIDNGQERSAKNYQLALQHMERFFGTTQVRFSQLTSVNVRKWIETLSGTARAKEKHPVCMEKVRQFPFRGRTSAINPISERAVGCRERAARSDKTARSE